MAIKREYWNTISLYDTGKVLALHIATSNFELGILNLPPRFLSLELDLGRFKTHKKTLLFFLSYLIIWGLLAQCLTQKDHLSMIEISWQFGHVLTPDDGSNSL